jgi:putative polyhydroxyalkanoate system protein
MSQAIDISLPHELGRAEAKRRIEAKIGRLQHYLPAGSATTSSWAGDRLDLKIQLLGQAVDAWVEVEERQLRCHVDLPMLLGMFAGTIESAIARKGPELLEKPTRDS